MTDRINICGICDRYNKESKTCNECGCYMPIKTLMPFAKCPLGKW